MRREGLVDYEWKESEAGPPRKYYQLTAKGRVQLAELTDYWHSINKTIESLGVQM
jgi:PadR family transcriptional regulator PadR